MRTSKRVFNGSTFVVNNALTAEEFLAETARITAKEYPDTKWVIGTYILSRKCLDCGDPYQGEVNVFPMTRSQRKIRTPEYITPTVIYRNGEQVFFTYGTSMFSRLEDKP